MIVQRLKGWRMIKAVAVVAVASRLLFFLATRRLPDLDAAATTTTSFRQNESVVEAIKPSQPLRPECLAIVQQAHAIDTTYSNVPGNHSTHPHMGALDEQGNPGYVHDETALKRNPPPSGITEEYLREECSNKDDDYILLKERVFVDPQPPLSSTQQSINSPTRRRAKIFCAIYTSSKSHGRLQLIRDTWGPKCDGFFAASDARDPVTDSVHLLHEGPEEYANMWQKVRSMWAYIYDHYYESYDWFHIGGDDMFLIVENLRHYVETDEIQTAQNGGLYLPDGSNTTQVPLFLGRRFKHYGDQDDLFNSGGPGYTLNRAALKTLVTKGLPFHFASEVKEYEDLLVSRTLKLFGVLPYDTRDNNGSERYMPYSPGYHKAYDANAEDWVAQWSFDAKEGLDCCAPRSVAFHYIKDAHMKRLFALLYHDCPTAHPV